MRYAMLLLVVLLVADCSKAPDRKIVCFGDSLTAGPGLRERETYPEQLERLLREYGYSYDVVNEGLSGDTSARGIGRIDAALASGADLLILEFGTNEIRRGESVDPIRKNLSRIIRKANKKHVTVLIAGAVAPLDAEPAYRAQVFSLYRELATRHNMPLMGDFLRDVRLESGTLRADGVHYNAKGAEILARSVFRKIEPMLSR